MGDWLAEREAKRARRTAGYKEGPEALKAMRDTLLREELAALAHEQWRGWMEYLFSKSVPNGDGTVTIPAWAVERWRRQIITSYAALPEEEKASDRAEADKVLALIGEQS